MRKLVFSTILVFLISCFSFVNANETKTHIDLENVEIINEATALGPWVCYVWRTYEEENMMTGVITVVTVYRCFQLQ